MRPASTLPLVVLDEVMLPGAATEVGLEPKEARWLEARQPGGGAFAVAIGCREPGKKAPTALEQKASGSPGPLAPAVLLGEGMLLPPDEVDPSPRLALEGATRGRLVSVEPDGDGWRAAVAPWPLEKGALDPEEVSTFVRRFYRALLSSRSGDAGEIRLEVERPVADLEGAPTAVTRLVLLADYLFERPDVRLQVLVAESAAEVRDLVADALDLVEEGLPKGEGPAKDALRSWLQAVSREGVTEMARTARVLRALAPVAGAGEALQAEAGEVASEMEALQERFDRLVTRLLKAPSRRR